MTHLIAGNTDARYSAFNNACRDLHNHYYNAPTTSGCSSQPPPLSFNDAPIDFLSPHFTGREEDLCRIGEVLGVVYDSAPARCGVYGMQGMGKTQLALQYAKISYNQQRHTVVFWISGATVEKLNQGLARVLTLIGHPDRDHTEQSTRLTAARRWFEESGVMWLLVLDNVTQEAVGFLREHLPRKGSSGNVLLTSRTRAVAETSTCAAGQQHPIFELRSPSLKDAVTLLLREAGIDMNDPASPFASGAEDMVKSVGFLPLAISHAASYAKQSGNNLDDVLAIYQSKDKYDVGCNH